MKRKRSTRQMKIREDSFDKYPRTLAILWTEYEYGIGGNKPAKYFTARERGMVKIAYCLRKILAISTEND